MIKMYLIIGALALVTIAGGILYHNIYEAGQEAVRVEQERTLKKLRDRTDAARDRAWDNPNPRDELRKFSDPNE